MYSEEIKYLSYKSGESTHVNKIRNTYFENRSCFTNVLDFLDQEVVIMPSNYFSYSEGSANIMKDQYIYVSMAKEYDRAFLISNLLTRIADEDGYHLSVLDNYLTVINGSNCIFTDKDMSHNKPKNIYDAIIIGTIFWVKNFNELLEKYSDRNLKRISKAIVCPTVKKRTCLCHDPVECLDDDFLLSMDIYKPEIVFKYTIDTHMSNICIDVYNKLADKGLNGLVDKYIPSYKQCDGYGEKGVELGCSTELCKCSGLRAFCYLDI
jgi:hypothetical protein